MFGTSVPSKVSALLYGTPIVGGSLIISPLINYGLGHVTGGKLSPWQYMYLIAGSVTFVWAILL